MATIEQDALRYYDENGYYLLHQPVFSDAKFEGLSDLFEDLLANATARPDKLDTPHFEEPRLLDYLLDDEIIDLVEPCIGPDIGLWSSHFICKEANRDRLPPGTLTRTTGTDGSRRLLESSCYGWRSIHRTEAMGVCV